MSTLSLTEELLIMKEGAKDRLTPLNMALNAQGIQELRDSGLAHGLKIGDKAPDFRLPDNDGQMVSLYEELAKGPVVLSFYRGGWCPYCNLELKAYQRVLDEIRELGAQVITISPQLKEYSVQTQEKNGVTFPVLIDRGNEVSDAYNLTFTLPVYLRDIYSDHNQNLEIINGDDTWNLPVTATYVIAQNGTILLGQADADYKKRLDPSDVIAFLKTL